MGLDLWFREDVSRILASVYEVMASSHGALSPAGSGDQQLAAAYRQGFVDSLRAVAVAFGVATPTMAGGPGGNGRVQSWRLPSGERE
jgi:hypothetical protein